ncbi:MAG: ribbon-helix-helix domain-containing protein [Cocleimonas sp.]|nr:ribbon-helix-helix domain-containing protein [Cocleimonas sp.]
MHFNIYLDDNLGERLIKATKESHKSRNALIREAVDLWLRTNENSSWPKQIMEFEGVADFPAFESYRDELKDVKDDPFA